tara:strand:+ start:84 stop:566 length:483 start_codon:yes stop_codon:yes gene_type:complete
MQIEDLQLVLEIHYPDIRLAQKYDEKASDFELRRTFNYPDSDWWETLTHNEDGSDASILKWSVVDGDENPVTKPTIEWCETKVIAARSTRGMALLRRERDRRLEETDWWAVSDRSMTSDQTNYRQALRDLPASTNALTKTTGQANTGEIEPGTVTWPTKP